ncbi:MAG: hypothetical protein ACI8TX_001322 [Hyphomicrobiaceae bacterium]
MRPFSQACENNTEPILGVLRQVFADRSCVLEIGSGTGQHAVAFAAAMPSLVWQTSERPENHAGIQEWISAEGGPNLRRPLTLDVASDPWPSLETDAAFSANTAHIMSLEEVAATFVGLGHLLPSGAPYALYGPFFMDDRTSAPSNLGFDRMLRERDPNSGIRRLDILDGLAAKVGIQREAMFALPANNDLIVWRRK